MMMIPGTPRIQSSNATTQASFRVPSQGLPSGLTRTRRRPGSGVSSGWRFPHRGIAGRDPASRAYRRRLLRLANPAST